MAILAVVMIANGLDVTLKNSVWEERQDTLR